MLGAAWTTLIPTLLIVAAAAAWFFSEAKTSHLNLIALLAAFLLCSSVAPDLTRNLTVSLAAASYRVAVALRLNYLLAHHANMLLTGAAVVWLVRRAWQTLWKPVPELISILGVEVPDAPDVSLAGIRCDAATVNWTRPPPNRSVQKFLIQVNGVVVGDVAANQEPAIVVSGLKPDHFYNVRVIAVGSNNFQAGSRVIRLRTFGKDGRPQLGSARLPSSFTADDQNGPGQREQGDDGGVPRSPMPALEAAAVSEGSSPVPRDASTAAVVASRRNTVTRKHSPSTTSQEALPIRDAASGSIEHSLPELTEKFENIRKEIEETVALICKEESENKRQLDELEAEKQEKKTEQKKKEEQTDQLKREVNATDRAMRSTMQKKAQKEKLLRDKQSERSKFHDNMTKWEKGIVDMRREQENFEKQKQDLEAERDSKLDSIREANEALQRECARMEAELKDKRDQVKELEDSRKQLGGEDDAESRAKDVEFRRECQRSQRELHEALLHENRTARRLDEQYRILSMQVGHIPGGQAGYNMYNQANNSGVDFDGTSLSQLKRRSRNGNSLSNISLNSPLPPYSQIDPSISGSTGFVRAGGAQGFAQGPFMNLGSGLPPRLDEAGIMATLAPLSPSATALLPSNILDDFDDDQSPTTKFDSELFPLNGSPDNDPQSPASSSRSLSIFSSPQGSSHNLPFSSGYGENAERRGLKTTATLPSEASGNKLSNFFSFQRARNPKGVDEDGVALGSLKHGQSQSFPRQTDDQDALNNRRRTSLAGTLNVFNRNSAGPEIMEGHAAGLRGFSVRTLNPFSNHARTPSALFSDRDPSSPRPASIASSDFPRPSTDSNSIWGPPAGEGSDMTKPSRLWQPAPWSRNASRRPSIHGSPSVLETTLASADDEILDDEALPNVSQVGVIGSRPPAPPKRLNPNAPTFIGSLFRTNKPEKEKDGVKEKEKGKGKDKDKSKDKAKDAKDRTKSISAPDTPHAPPSEADSPSDSRKSRDALSVHTQTSVSESRESLSLDHTLSNTPSELVAVPGVKDDGNVVRKLFRKGSSSKFSLAGRLGGKVADGSSLFKKGPGSVASSTDRGGAASVERSSIGDFEEVVTPSAVDDHFRGYDSASGSPNLGPASGSMRAAKDGKMGSARWLSFSKKGKKEKESLEMERDAAEEK